MWRTQKNINHGRQGGLRGPNLTNVSERLSTEQITIAILAGKEGQGMPSYAGTLSVEEVQALVAFLEAQTEEASR